MNQLKTNQPLRISKRPVLVTGTVTFTDSSARVMEQEHASTVYALHHPKLIDLPRVLCGHVMRFVGGGCLTRVSSKSIRADARNLSALFQVDRRFHAWQHDLVGNRLSLLAQMHRLTSKYSKFDGDFDADCEWNLQWSRPVDASPILVDALSTGCRLPYAKSTFDSYTSDIEMDIKEMIVLMPETLKSRTGQLRCRSRVPPLVMACANDNIPVRMVRFLLNNGADPKQRYKFNNGDITIDQDLDNLTMGSDHRAKSIRILLGL